MTNDSISDMLTRIRNASRVRHGFVYVPYSKLNLAILSAIAKEGYLENYAVEKSKTKTFQNRIKIVLKYKGWWVKKPFFSILQRISKPGHRIFSGYQGFTKKMNALQYEQGVAVISTSSGVMSHSRAAQLRLGGEILCYIE